MSLARSAPYYCRVILVKLCCAFELHVGKGTGSVLPCEVRALILPCVGRVKCIWNGWGQCALARSAPFLLYL